MIVVVGIRKVIDDFTVDELLALDLRVDQIRERDSWE